MNLFKAALKIFVLMTFLTGVAYPLLVTFIAQIVMPVAANGSLLYRGKQVIGSTLIAQKFTDERYFWPRPSAIEYDPLKPSGGSNLGPTSQKLKDLVAERQKFAGSEAPVELLYASASGLDPHISLETAYYQSDRIAKARMIDKSELIKMINAASQGLRKPRYVNVLLLNKALDER